MLDTASVNPIFKSLALRVLTNRYSQYNFHAKLCHRTETPDYPGYT